MKSWKLSGKISELEDVKLFFADWYRWNVQTAGHIFEESNTFLLEWSKWNVHQMANFLDAKFDFSANGK